ncbi:hypothetical protein MAPG_09429 [Magnaporthiopsis poae ATCC 64411]|uniref:Uncharacterized protein n=1 Tax=Magnaporthiopsis poae (strain ATCC 64411 / 73-15) TaxID=644358 RepID=A0A0C4E9X9_MAGP6|nr:hypothetical protein MAPG_09429 [Magnaporthiopsis poae ATCC 64411]
MVFFDIREWDHKHRDTLLGRLAKSFKLDRTRVRRASSSSSSSSASSSDSGSGSAPSSSSYDSSSSGFDSGSESESPSGQQQRPSTPELTFPYPAVKCIIGQHFLSCASPRFWGWLIVCGFFDADDNELWHSEVFIGQDCSRGWSPETREYDDGPLPPRWAALGTLPPPNEDLSGLTIRGYRVGDRTYNILDGQLIDVTRSDHHIVIQRPGSRRPTPVRSSNRNASSVPTCPQQGRTLGSVRGRSGNNNSNSSSRPSRFTPTSQPRHATRPSQSAVNFAAPPYPVAQHPYYYYPGYHTAHPPQPLVQQPRPAVYAGQWTPVFDQTTRRWVPVWRPAY